MGDIAEDTTEALRVIDAYVKARIATAFAEDEWHMSRRRYGTRLHDADKFQECGSADYLARQEMETTLRALIDPRACA